jgi:hypothetical protein
MTTSLMFSSKAKMSRNALEAREILVLDQYDNSTNSKLARWLGGGWFPLGLAVTLGSIVMIEASTYRIGLTGRLHPALVPIGLVGSLALAALNIVRRRGIRAERGLEDEATMALHDGERSPVTGRSILTCLLSIGILGALTGALGLAVTVFLAAFTCTLGIVGVPARRRIMIAGGIAIVASAIFIVLLRLPLPILPGGTFW